MVTNPIKAQYLTDPTCQATTDTPKKNSISTPQDHRLGPPIIDLFMDLSVYLYMLYSIQ